MMAMADDLTALLKSEGADLVGFADLRDIPADVRRSLPYGVSIAVALDRDVLSEIVDGPTGEYHTEYQRVNRLLDALGRRAAELIEDRGHRARSFAATNEGIDWDALTTPLPHKTVATRAGLGWIGKCALLVTKPFGSAVRITTVLTDAEFPVGTPMDESRCGDCTACADACPAHAVTGTEWAPGVARDSLLDAPACRKVAEAMTLTRTGFSEIICGVCIVACPWTKRYIERSGDDA